MPAGTASSPKGTLLPNGRALDDASVIPCLAQDARFALDQLAVLNQADPSGILKGKLDLQRIDTFGVSLGGIVAGEACRMDPRLRACLVMDAAMPSDVVTAGLHQPSMWITRDADSMRLERQRTGGWTEADIEAHQSSMRAVYEGLPGAGYFVRVPGMFHANFTDIASWTPLAAQLGLSGPIDEHRAHDIVNDYFRVSCCKPLPRSWLPVGIVQWRAQSRDPSVTVLTTQQSLKPTPAPPCARLAPPA